MRYLYGPPFGTDREEWGDISLLTTEMLFKIGCPPYVGQGFGVPGEARPPTLRSPAYICRRQWARQLLRPVTFSAPSLRTTELLRYR